MKNIATIITTLRKQKGWSQTDLARESTISREILGKYERGEAVPSIDFAKRIADALGVTLDFLVGNGTVEIDKAGLNRLKEVDKMNPEDKTLVWAFLDAFILKNKLQNVMQ